MHRAYYAYDVSALTGKKIVEARLTLVRPALDCAERIRSFQLWQTGPISRHTDGKHQPEWISSLYAVPGEWACRPSPSYELVATPTTAWENGVATYGVRGSFEDRPQGPLVFRNDPQLRITYEYEEKDPFPGDPTLPVDAASPDAWTHVDSRRRHEPHWKEETPLPVGRRDRHGVTRSFLRFDLATLPAGRPVEARLFVRRADTCRVGEKTIELWQTGPIDERTTWHRQPTWLRLIDTYAWGSCDDESGTTLLFDATEAVTEARAAGKNTVTFGLRSSRERDPGGAYLIGHDSLLRVSSLPPLRPPAEIMTDRSGYHWPDPPAAGSRPSLYGGGRPPYIPYFPAPEAIFSGGAHPLSTRWQWETLEGVAVHEEVAYVEYNGLSMGSPRGADGESYRWRVRSEDRYGQVSEWSPWCEYTVDITRPAPAVVTATPYSGLDLVGGPGVPGRFTFAPNGAKDVTDYYYTVPPAERWQHVPAGPDGSVTLTWTPRTAGLHQMAVFSVDRAGNRADLTSYYFAVAAPPQ
nr:hypothetical protein GCM10020093_025160 [Planobispora longispora]